MKTLLVLIGMALGCAAQTSGYDAAEVKEKDALRAYWICRESGDVCDSARAAYVSASDEVQIAINRELEANNAQIASAIVDLDRITEHIRAYAACRRARRWWQVWKGRCRWKM